MSTDNFCFVRSLGDEEAKTEFNELFDDLIVDVVENMKKYSDIVKQLESLLELEKETLLIKKKVATFSLDYDDNLVINRLMPSNCFFQQQHCIRHMPSNQKQTFLCLSQG